MAYITELLNEIRVQETEYIGSPEYHEHSKRIEEGNLIQAMRETPGWEILRRELKNNLEAIKHDLLFGEESEDPVKAKIERMEKRAFGKAVILIAEHTDKLLRMRKESVEVIGRGNNPEEDIE